MLSERVEVDTEPAPSTSAVAALDHWLARRRRAVLLLIIVASVLLRLTYFVQLNDGPCVWQHRSNQTDMNFFHTWAQEIAGGDWLSDQSLHPHHDWHHLIARLYLSAHPQQDALPSTTHVDPTVGLWERWYGGKRFHQEPLYPYLIAFTYKLLGPDVRWVFAWQLAVGVLTNVLIFSIARRQFGEVAGLAAAVFAVLCGPMLLYEMVLLRTTLLTCAGLLLVYLTILAFESGSWQRWLSVGVGLGFALLLKTVFLLFALALVGTLLSSCRREWKTGAAALAALTVGSAFVLAPAAARNLAVGVPPASLSSVGAITFICANAEDNSSAEGFYVSFEHAPRIMGETEGHLLPSIVATLRTHQDAWSYARQLLRKFTGLWHWYESPNNVNYYYYEMHAGILTLMPVTFRLLAPLSILGLLLAARHPRRHAYPLLLVGTSIVPLLAFYVLSRLRAPLVAALIPFAALAVAQALEWAAVQSWRSRTKVGLLAVAGILLSLWTARPLPAELPAIRPSDYITAHRVYYGILERRSRDAGDWQRVVETLREALRFEPQNVRQLKPGVPALSPEDRELGGFYAKVYRRYARALQRTGNHSAASEANERASELVEAIR